MGIYEFAIVFYLSFNDEILVILNFRCEGFEKWDEKLIPQEGKLKERSHKGGEGIARTGGYQWIKRILFYNLIDTKNNNEFNIIENRGIGDGGNGGRRKE